MKKIRRSLVALAAATAVTVAGAPAASAATYPEPLNQVIDKLVEVGGPQAPNALLVPFGISSLSYGFLAFALIASGSSK